MKLNPGQIKEALGHANEAVKLDPKSTDARIIRGLIYRTMRNFKAAEEDFESVHTQSPGNSLAINQLALTLIEKPDDDSQSRALQFAEMNARQNPRNVETGATLGWVYYKLGKRTEAEKVFQMIFQTGATNSPDTMFYLASYYKEKGNIDEAKRLLTSAIQGDRLFPYRAQAEEMLRTLNEKGKGKPAPKAADGAKGDK
jgi:tetratricopeptide (TPR) repeat protein